MKEVLRPETGAARYCGRKGSIPRCQGDDTTPKMSESSVQIGQSRAKPVAPIGHSPGREMLSSLSFEVSMVGRGFIARNAESAGQAPSRPFSECPTMRELILC